MDTVCKKYCITCGKFLGAYPGPSDPDNPTSPPMTPQKFNPMKRCRECQSWVQQERINSYKHLDRKWIRTSNRKNRAALAEAEQTIERQRRERSLLEQRIARLEQQVLDLGGRIDW